MVETSNNQIFMFSISSTKYGRRYIFTLLKKNVVRFSQSGGRMTTHLYRKSIIIQCKGE
jgi:hypothetical protein